MNPAALAGRHLAQEDAMAREILPLDQDAKPPDPVYVDGRHNGQYMMDLDQYTSKWVVRGRIGAETSAPLQRIGAWDYDTAQRILDYAVEHDVSMRTALQNLYILGEPDLLLDLVEKAKAARPERLTTKLTYQVNVSHDLGYFAAMRTAIKHELGKALQRACETPAAKQGHVTVTFEERDA